MNFQKAVLLILILSTSFCRVTIEISVSKSSVWFVKWLNFVPIVTNDTGSVVLVDQLISKIYIFGDLYEKFAEKPESFFIDYMINNHDSYTSVTPSLKNTYQTDFVYNSEIKVDELCEVGNPITVATNFLKKNDDGYRLTITISCTEKPAQAHVGEHDPSLGLLKPIIPKSHLEPNEIIVII